MSPCVEAGPSEVQAALVTLPTAAEGGPSGSVGNNGEAASEGPVASTVPQWVDQRAAHGQHPAENPTNRQMGTHSASSPRMG
jgi:hypothetical protein